MEAINNMQTRAAGREELTAQPNQRGPVDQAGTVNINAAISTLLAVIGLLQQATNLETYNTTQLEADATQRENTLNQNFYSWEHSPTNPSSSPSDNTKTNPSVPDPADAYWNFQNCIYAISNDTDCPGGNAATFWAPLYNVDNARLQTGTKTLDQESQEYQAQVSNLANIQSGYMQMGSVPVTYEQSFSRLLA